MLTHVAVCCWLNCRVGIVWRSQGHFSLTTVAPVDWSTDWCWTWKWDSNTLSQTHVRLTKKSRTQSQRSDSNSFTLCWGQHHHMLDDVAVLFIGSIFCCRLNTLCCHRSILAVKMMPSIWEALPCRLFNDAWHSCLLLGWLLFGRFV